MAALNCCVAGWNYIGDNIKKMCGNLNDKDLGMNINNYIDFIFGTQVDCSPKFS